MSIVRTIFTKISFKNGTTKGNETTFNTLETNIQAALDDMRTKVENAIPGIVDNLTSTNTDKALSANQGKVLDKRVSELEEGLTDITSQCSFVNCSFDGGYIVVDKKKKIAYLAVMVTPSVTNGWGNLIEIPLDFKIKPIIQSQAGATITASEFWAYNESDKVRVRGAYTKSSQIVIQGYYFMQ